MICLICITIDLVGAKNIVFSNGDLDPWRGGGVSWKKIYSIIYYRRGELKYSEKCCTFLLGSQNYQKKIRE